MPAPLLLEAAELLLYAIWDLIFSWDYKSEFSLSETAFSQLKTYKMKRNYKILSGCMVFVALIATSCTKYFNAINTDPNSVTSVTPEQMFARASINAHSGDFEWFYDYYEDMMPWMQMLVPTTGNAAGFIANAGITNNRYGYFYGGVGNYLAEAQHLIDNMPADQKAARVYERAITQVLMVYYAFYVSDI